MLNVVSKNIVKIPQFLSSYVTETWWLLSFLTILYNILYGVVHSSEHNALYIHQWQDRDKPCNVPTPQGS